MSPRERKLFARTERRARFEETKVAVLTNGPVLARSAVPRSAIWPLYSVAPYEFARESRGANDRRGMHSHTFDAIRLGIGGSIHPYVRTLVDRRNREESVRAVWWSLFKPPVRCATLPRFDWQTEAHPASSFLPLSAPFSFLFFRHIAAIYGLLQEGGEIERGREGRPDKSLVVKRAEIGCCARATGRGLDPWADEG